MLRNPTFAGNLTVPARVTEKVTQRADDCFAVLSICGMKHPLDKHISVDRSLEMAEVSKSNRADKVRITVDLSKSLNDHLEQISKDTGRSKAEILRLSIDFLLRANQAKHEGMTVGAFKFDPEKNTRVEREFVGLN